MAEPCDKCGKLDANQCKECNPVKEMSLEVALDFADNPRPYHTLQAPADTNGELYRALAVLAAAYRKTTQLSWTDHEEHRAFAECIRLLESCRLNFNWPELREAMDKAISDGRKALKTSEARAASTSVSKSAVTFEELASRFKLEEKLSDAGAFGYDRTMMRDLARDFFNACTNASSTSSNVEQGAGEAEKFQFARYDAFSEAHKQVAVEVAALRKNLATALSAQPAQTAQPAGVLDDEREVIAQNLRDDAAALRENENLHTFADNMERAAELLEACDVKCEVGKYKNSDPCTVCPNAARAHPDQPTPSCMDGGEDAVEMARTRGPLTAEDVERQYRDGIDIGSGLPRATCPCGFCKKHRNGFNVGDAAAPGVSAEELMEALRTSADSAAPAKTEKSVVAQYQVRGKAEHNGGVVLRWFNADPEEIEEFRTREELEIRELYERDSNSSPSVKHGECVHANDAKSCYRVRCQLGNKCVDDELSPRTASTALAQMPENLTCGRLTVLGLDAGLLERVGRTVFARELSAAEVREAIRALMRIASVQFTKTADKMTECDKKEEDRA
jgi:hypothetical protein